MRPSRRRLAANKASHPFHSGAVLMKAHLATRSSCLDVGTPSTRTTSTSSPQNLRAVSTRKSVNSSGSRQGATACTYSPMTGGVHQSGRGGSRTRKTVTFARFRNECHRPLACPSISGLAIAPADASRDLGPAVESNHSRRRTLPEGCRTLRKVRESNPQGLLQLAPLPTESHCQLGQPSISQGGGI